MLHKQVSYAGLVRFARGKFKVRGALRLFVARGSPAAAPGTELLPAKTASELCAILCDGVLLVVSRGEDYNDGGRATGATAQRQMVATAGLPPPPRHPFPGRQGCPDRPGENANGDLAPPQAEQRSVAAGDSRTSVLVAGGGEGQEVGTPSLEQGGGGMNVRGVSTGTSARSVVFQQQPPVCAAGRLPQQHSAVVAPVGFQPAAVSAASGEPAFGEPMFGELASGELTSGELPSGESASSELAIAIFKKPVATRAAAPGAQEMAGPFPVLAGDVLRLVRAAITDEPRIVETAQPDGYISFDYT